MKEKIFNLFYFIDNDIVTELGVTIHEIGGSDQDKQAFLQNSVYEDFKKSIRFKPPANLCRKNKTNILTLSYYMALARQGRTLEVFEEIFQKYDAPNNRMCCVTAIVNGIPEIDTTVNFDPFYLSEHQGHPKLGPGSMSDYLEDYMTDKGFDLPRLIHQDYYQAIKLLFNNGHYVSCVKLLVSFIDTLSFLEYGDQNNNFIDWLNEYADLSPIGITSSQLWELRNSVLHMSNLDSRKVLKGKEKRISFCVAKSGYVPEGSFDTTYFNLLDLLNTIAQALSYWISSFNTAPEKFTKFIERYDRIISDDRHAMVHIDKENML